MRVSVELNKTDLNITNHKRAIAKEEGHWKIIIRTHWAQWFN